MIIRSRSDKLFDSTNTLLLILFAMTTLYPMIYLISLSLSDAGGASTLVFSLFPRTVSWENYTRVFNSDEIYYGYRNTIIRTVLGTVIQVLAIVLTAYPLSKKYLPHRAFWTSLIVFTMFFSGGLIPGYLLVKNLKLTNTVWSLILPGLVPTYTMIIARNFFMNIPDSLEESARVDGANDLRILFQIILPVSKPILATVTLWQLVGHWNAWFDSMLYITENTRQVLQIFLRRIVLLGTQTSMNMENSSLLNDFTSINPDSIKAATIMAATLPIIMIYPFLQKYFVKGVLVGSLKG